MSRHPALPAHCPTALRPAAPRAHAPRPAAPRAHASHPAAARALALAALLVAAAGCASAPRAGTGDVAFRLAWRGASDLDLMIEDPAGECLFYGMPKIASGGTLDVDCNGATDRPCGKPIENAYWPTGAAPRGTYRLWVHAHSLVPEEAPLAFELDVLRGERVATVLRDQARAHQELVGPFTYAFPEGRATPTTLRKIAPVPACSGLATGMRPVP